MVCDGYLRIRSPLYTQTYETLLSILSRVRATRPNSIIMNFDASASSTATVAVGMYYPTTLIGSSSSSSPSGALSFRRCSIRNCPHFVAEGSSNKMCEGCRGRHRIYASAKRARRKANDARSNDNSGPGTAEDWLGLNSVSDLQVSNASSIRIYCLQTVRNPNLKSSCHNPQTPCLQLFIPSLNSYPTGRASIPISSLPYPLL